MPISQEPGSPTGRQVETGRQPQPNQFLKSGNLTVFPSEHGLAHPNIIGWMRLGDNDHPRAMAVLMSNGPGGSKWMEVGRPNAVFCDLTQHIGDLVRANGDGWGEFRCNGGSVSVWLEQ